MSTVSILLVVVAAFVHATWNLLAKRAAAVGVAFVFYSHVIGSVLYAPWALYVIAKGAVSWSSMSVSVIILSAVIHLGYSLCLQRGYQVADLSVVYPTARGTGPLLSTSRSFSAAGRDPFPAGLARTFARGGRNRPDRYQRRLDGIQPTDGAGWCWLGYGDRRVNCLLHRRRCLCRQGTWHCPGCSGLGVEHTAHLFSDACNF